ncbi:MAG: ankyrin repeat-containing domain protein [Linnemannia gamsii]|nr:MAG: ankyrin repeat-containing domain protein [Linnemannia gamsii]
MAQRIPAFLRSKKLKKRTRPVILHNIEMAIRDKKPELALQYISLLPSNALKKKKKKSYSDLNHCMLLAMIYRMEQVAIELVDRGFPIDVNYPIIGKARDEYKTKAGRTGPFEYPSYFIVAVGLGMCNLVRAMIKNANLNQSWCGLTPLLLATTLNECTNATCPPPTLPPGKLASMLSRGERVHLDISSQTLISQLPSAFNKSPNTQFRIPGYTPTSPNSIVTTLLEYGADPNQGITLQQYLWANKLKGMGVLSRRRKILDPKSAPGENPIEFYIAARRHESGRQWLSHAEIKARKVAKALEAQAMGGKKRFSSEMQEYWKDKSILPVELAIASGNLDCARTILQRLGPHSLAKSSFGLLLQNDVMLTLSLIKSGTPVSQHDLHGCTPLHLAARRGHLEMVMVLLQLGGDMNSRGERQWTPLHESMSQNHANISSLLVASGTDVTAKNDAGETAEELGKRRGLTPEVIADHLGTFSLKALSDFDLDTTDTCLYVTTDHSILIPPFSLVYIDKTKSKACSAGLMHSFGAHLPTHMSTAVAETRSGSSSRRASHEQLTTNTFKSMMMSSGSNRDHLNSNERNHASMDQARLSGHYASSMASSLGDLSQNGSSTAVGSIKSHLSMSKDSLPQQSNGHGQVASNGGGASGGQLPLTPSSSSSSLTGSRSSTSSEKKKKVRGFLKKIFN